MPNRSTANKIDRYFIQVRLLSSGSLKKVEICAAKAFLQRQFPELTETTDLSHQEIQRRLVLAMQSSFTSDTPNHSDIYSETDSSPTSDATNDAMLAECCLRCFVSHHISLVCIELEQRFRGQSSFRAVDVLPHVLSDTNPYKSKQDYEKSYQQDYIARKNDQLEAEFTASKDYRFQVPLAIHIVHTFDPNKGNLIAWTKLLTLQHRELNRVLAEYGIHRKTDWAILNHHTPARVKRLLSGILTDTEIQSMSVVLESYHAIYRSARSSFQQAGKPCKDPDQAQLEAMVHDLEKRGVGYSPEQVMQTLRALALKLRYRQPESSEEFLRNRSQSQPSAEEREQELFLQYQQELLCECLNQVVKQVLDEHLNHLRQKKPRKSSKLPKDQLFLEAMQLFYCEGKSMTEIAPMIGRQQEYQVSRLLELKTLREQVREPWLNLTCNRVSCLLAAYIGSEQPDQRQQQLDQLMAVQIDQIIAEDETNSYRRQRAANTVFADGFRNYLTSQDC